MYSGYEESICWNCMNSVPDDDERGCPWSLFGEPVEGWEATPSYISANGVQCARSYCVHRCPLFREG